MRSYQEMVECKIKEINDDKQQINWFKERVAKEKKHSQTLAATLSQVSEKLRRATEENRIVRERTKIQHDENKEEVMFWIWEFTIFYYLQKYFGLWERRCYVDSI